MTILCPIFTKFGKKFEHRWKNFFWNFELRTGILWRHNGGSNTSKFKYFMKNLNKMAILCPIFTKFGRKFLHIYFEIFLHFKLKIAFLWRHIGGQTSENLIFEKVQRNSSIFYSVFTKFGKSLETHILRFLAEINLLTNS